MYSRTIMGYSVSAELNDDIIFFGKYGSILMKKPKSKNQLFTLRTVRDYVAKLNKLRTYTNIKIVPIYTFPNITLSAERVTNLPLITATTSKQKPIDRIPKLK